MGTNFTELESVQRHIAESAQYVGAVHADRCGRWLTNSSFDSQLEAIFYVWWMAMIRAGEISDCVTWNAQQEVVAGGHKYRLDFHIVPEYQLRQRAEAVGVKVPKLGVELDGHDFHERTKEQVTYRNQRDRDLAADGWTVLHFSGSELYRDPTSCVNSAFDHGYKLFGSWVFEQSVIEAEIAAERAAGYQVGAQTSQES